MRIVHSSCLPQKREHAVFRKSRNRVNFIQIEFAGLAVLKKVHAAANDRENIFYASDLSENFVNMIQKVLEVEESDLILKFKNLDL